MKQQKTIIIMLMLVLASVPISFAQGPEPLGARFTPSITIVQDENESGDQSEYQQIEETEATEQEASSTTGEGTVASSDSAASSTSAATPITTQSSIQSSVIQPKNTRRVAVVVMPATSARIQAREIPETVKVSFVTRIGIVKGNYTKISQDVVQQRQLFVSATETEREDIVIGYAKIYLQKVADLLITSLERIKLQFESSEDITAEELPEIVAEIDDLIADVERARLGVESASTKQEVKDAGRMILSVWGDMRPIINRLSARAIHAKTNGLVMRMQHLQYQLECSLTSIENPEARLGVENLIQEFGEHIKNAEQHAENARVMLQEAKQYQLNRENSAEANTKITQAKAEVNKAKQELQLAHNKLKDIVKGFRDAGGQIRACDSEGDEVVEDTLEEFCGTSTLGTCYSDEDCSESGCSGQICQSKSEEPSITTCELLACYDAQAYGMSCVCIEGHCKWG